MKLALSVAQASLNFLLLCDPASLFLIKKKQLKKIKMLLMNQTS